jgi:hypothetical protein
MRAIPIFLAAICLISGKCVPVEDQKITGNWAVDGVTVGGAHQTHLFNSNFLKFSNDHTCQLPTRSNDLVSEGRWQTSINNDSVVIAIESHNSMFGNVFKVRFVKDPVRKTLGMELRSQGVEIYCTKALTGYQEWEDRW